MCWTSCLVLCALDVSCYEITPQACMVCTCMQCVHTYTYSTYIHTHTHKATHTHDSFKGGMDMSSVSVHGCTLDPSIGVWGRGLNFVLCGTVVVNFVIYIFVGWL